MNVTCLFSWKAWSVISAYSPTKYETSKKHLKKIGSKLQTCMFMNMSHQAAPWDPNLWIGTTRVPVYRDVHQVFDHFDATRVPLFVNQFPQRDLRLGITELVHRFHFRHLSSSIGDLLQKWYFFKVLIGQTFVISNSEVHICRLSDLRKCERLYCTHSLHTIYWRINLNFEHDFWSNRSALIFIFTKD